MQDLNVSLIQRQLAWEQPGDNRQQIGEAVAALPGETDLVVLPEMFTTGFSMNALANAEEEAGPTRQWMQALATEHDFAVTGSIAVRIGDAVFNRMLFVTPDKIHHYDKRHLFRMAGEQKRYAAGTDRVIVPWRGWRILLQVCYDLRFPVFSRNRGDYDLALYVANWPSTRALHWRQLLIGRAIENLACVVGVNRIGSDANGLDYSGDSLAVAADGELLVDMRDREAIETVCFDADRLGSYRAKFPFAADADDFTIG